MTEILKKMIPNSARVTTGFLELGSELEVNVPLSYEQRKEFEEFGKENLKLTLEHKKIYEMEKRLKDADL